MRRSASLNRITAEELAFDARSRLLLLDLDDTIVSQRRRFPLKLDELRERYSITIKPQFLRSNSLSELTTNASDFNFQDSKFLIEDPPRGLISDFVDYNTNHYLGANYMSWNFKGKKKKKGSKMSETYGTKFANEYVKKPDPGLIDPSISSAADNTSICSTGSLNKSPTFPFESTPSGNLKVQSNQVVFQSSAVGVLLVVADPDKTKVKVQFEGNAAGEDNPDDVSTFEQENLRNKKVFVCRENKNPELRKEKGKDLYSLGYTVQESIDWTRIQLPQKADLFQEFYRRIHNFINTDTVIHIGDEDFHCHHMVLQVYSSFFEKSDSREVELPIAKVSPEAFHTIYEWMIFGAPESQRLLKTTNILEIFSAAQFLSIKDLEEQCWAFIVNDSIFNEDTAFALFREARARGMTHITELMVPRVMRFFLPLVSSTDYLELEPDEVMTFLKSNYICVTSEVEVLMAGIRWLYGDWSRRKHLAVEVMSCIRFGLISPWQLVDLKRNPDNAEILDIVNEPDIQQMVDDGLAYVIIKYWYGNNSKNYYHWIEVLGLTEPAERNWIGEEKNHVNYKDFLEYLKQFLIPKEQMFQTLALMQPARRKDDMPGNPMSMDKDKMEMRRPKLDFPLPANLRGLSPVKDKPFPTMNEFFENRRKIKEVSSPPAPSSPGNRFMCPGPNLSFSHQSESPTRSNLERKKPSEEKKKNSRDKEQEKLLSPTYSRRQNMQQVHTCRLEPEIDSRLHKSEEMFEPPERDSTEENLTTVSETSSSPDSSIVSRRNQVRRQSIAANYIAAATAALAATNTKKETSNTQTTGLRPQLTASAQKPEFNARPQVYNTATISHNLNSPQISLFNQSKELLAKKNMNRLSTSILGPSNKSYTLEGSLFNWDRETVLVFGGIDPHTKYGLGKNTGKDIYRYDPVTNVWDYVGDLPEPRHHHSVAFLRGRVYLVGGADPRDDDMRGKSVVVSTVWSYEPVTRSWYSEFGLAVPRKNFGLVVHQMALYAIGGQDKKGRVLRSMERFDPKTSTWMKMRPMATARMAVAATKYRDYIWVAGGMTGEKKKPVCKIVECYNSKTDEWTQIHDLRFPRCFATLFSMNDKLFIIGGAGRVPDKDKIASSVDDIDVWEWKTREWKQHTKMSIPRHGHALAYLGTQLFIIGGVTTIYMRALNNVESYCCERGAWIRGVATLPSPMSGHGAVTLPPSSLM